jgi:hypothetical protein
MQHRTHVLDVHAVPEDKEMMEIQESPDIMDVMDGGTICRFLRDTEVKIYA